MRTSTNALDPSAIPKDIADDEDKLITFQKIREGQLCEIWVFKSCFWSSETGYLLVHFSDQNKQNLSFLDVLTWMKNMCCSNEMGKDFHKISKFLTVGKVSNLLAYFDIMDIGIQDQNGSSLKVDLIGTNELISVLKSALKLL